MYAGGDEKFNFAWHKLFITVLTDHVDLDKFKLSVWVYSSFLFLASAVLVPSVQPYKWKYMNVLDTLLLVHLNVIFMLLSREYFPGDGTQLFVLLLMPQVVFGLLLLYKLCTLLKNKVTGSCKLCSNYSIAIEPLESDDQEQQPLINPTFSSV